MQIWTYFELLGSCRKIAAQLGPNYYLSKDVVQVPIRITIKLSVTYKALSTLSSHQDPLIPAKLHDSLGQPDANRVQRTSPRFHVLLPRCGAWGHGKGEEELEPRDRKSCRSGEFRIGLNDVNLGLVSRSPLIHPFRHCNTTCPEARSTVASLRSKSTRC